MVTAITNAVVAIIAGLAAAIAVLIMALWVLRKKFKVQSTKFTVLFLGIIIEGEGRIGLIPTWIGDLCLVITIVYILYSTRGRPQTIVEQQD